MTNNWPDPNKPGYPVNADKNGAHRIRWRTGNEESVLWFARDQHWIDQEGDPVCPNTASGGNYAWKYLGPCDPNAYVDGFNDGRKQAAECMREWCDSLETIVSPRQVEWQHMIERIQSIPHPTCKPSLQVPDDPDALTAAYQMGRTKPDLSAFEALADEFDRRGLLDGLDDEFRKGAITANSACGVQLRAVIAQVKGGTP